MNQKKGTILLLQGPMGPFFFQTGRLLQKAGWTVVKINFNLGDLLFYPTGALNFRGSREEWPAFLQNVLIEKQIERIFLFGDCRPLHSAAIKVARALKIPVSVFEEGYLRPNFITVENEGVNGYSQMPRDALYYRRLSSESRRPTVQIRTYPYAIYVMACYAILYFLAGRIGAFIFPHYAHHKPFHVFDETIAWTRSVWRKQTRRRAERRMGKRLRGPLAHRYFLVPLQVFNDAQVHHHSEISVAGFIEQVTASFARSAPTETILLFKQHPMDRGHINHEPLVRKLAEKYGVAERILFSRDCHLPTAIDNAIATVVINSTVGLQSIHHGVPVKVLGRAIFDLPGLTYQGHLDDFWKKPGEVDRELYRAFRLHLLATNQFYGSYSRKPLSEYIARWARGKGPVSAHRIRQKERERRRSLSSLIKLFRFDR